MANQDPASDDPRFDTVPEAAKHWKRSAKSVYDEIEHGDYREEQGVFFRHLPKREWRINRFQFQYWRRLPPAATSDALFIQMCDFLLQHLEPSVTAEKVLLRFLRAEREAASLRVEEKLTQSTSDGEPAALLGGGRPKL
jgi:hypothetical protein